MNVVDDGSSGGGVVADVREVVFQVWCIRLSTSSCIKSCIRIVRSGHVVRENRLF